MEKQLIKARPHYIYFVYPGFMLLIGIIVFVGSMLFVPTGAMATNTNDPTLMMGSITGAMIAISCCCPIGILLLGYGGFYLLFVIIGFSSWHLTVTTQRVIICAGILRRSTREILLHQIESINVRKGIIGGILNYGQIQVVGTGGSRVTSVIIDDPENIRSKINTALFKSR